MFSHSFQTGEQGVEILSPSGTTHTGLDPGECAVVREYERSIKGYAFALNKAVSCIKMPASTAVRFKSLGIFQPLFCFQLQCMPEATFNLEVIVLGRGGQRKRIHFSSSFSRIDANELHGQVPFEIENDNWTNYAINIAFYMSELFSNVEFEALESFKLRVVGKVRKIFSLPYPRDNNPLVIPPTLGFPMRTEVGLIIRTPELDEKYRVCERVKEAENRASSPRKRTALKDSRQVESVPKASSLSVKGTTVVAADRSCANNGSRSSTPNTQSQNAESVRGKKSTVHTQQKRSTQCSPSTVEIQQPRSVDEPLSSTSPRVPILAPPLSCHLMLNQPKQTTAVSRLSFEHARAIDIHLSSCDTETNGKLSERNIEIPQLPATRVESAKETYLRAINADYGPSMADFRSLESPEVCKEVVEAIQQLLQIEEREYQKIYQSVL